MTPETTSAAAELTVVSAVMHEAQPLTGEQYSTEEISVRLREAMDYYGVKLADERINKLAVTVADALNTARRPEITVENDLFDTE